MQKSNKKILRIVRIGCSIYFVLCLGIFAWMQTPAYKRSAKRSQLQARVSRVKIDFKYVVPAMEAFYVDHNYYPPMHPLSVKWADDPEALARINGTKLSYLGRGSQDNPGIYRPYVYLTGGGRCYDQFYLESDPRWDTDYPPPAAYYRDPDSRDFILFSRGPDLDYDITDPESFFPAYLDKPTSRTTDGRIVLPIVLIQATYDPTNGLISSGDIWRMKKITSWERQKQ